MTKLDRFALAIAAAAWGKHPTAPEYTPKAIAKTIYDIAEALVKESEARNK